MHASDRMEVRDVVGTERVDILRNPQLAAQHRVHVGWGWETETRKRVLFSLNTTVLFALYTK